MGKTTVVIVFLFGILFVGTTHAESTSRSDQVRSLLEHCGVLERLQQFPKQVFSQIGHKQDPPGSKKHRTEQKAFIQAFNVEQMKEDLINKMAQRIDEGTTRIALEWFQSPTGIRIANLEKTTYSTHAWQEKQVFPAGTCS